MPALMWFGLVSNGMQKAVWYMDEGGRGRLGEDKRPIA